MEKMEEERFTELLQPLRDLAANFDIDIAESLENYLEELEGISFSLDGKKGLNFAEAALLIQGSTTIYSRKVEHLHKLVLQALELVTSKKDNKKNNNNDENESSSKNSKDLQNCIDEERLLFGTDPSYLLLDDVLEEGRNIDLEPETIEARDKRRSSGRYSLSGEISRASMILMHSILAEDHSGASLKISCQVDKTGALIMGGILPAQSNTSRLFIDQAMEKENDNSAQFFANDDGQAYDNDDGNNYDYGDDDGDAMEQPDTWNPPQENAASKKKDIVAPRKIYKKQTSTSLLDPYERVTGSKIIKKGSTFRVPTLLSINQQSSSDKKSNASAFESFLLEKIPLTGIVNHQFKDIVKYQKNSYLKNARSLRSTQEQNENIFLYKEINDEERRSEIDANDYVADDNDDGEAWYDAGADDDDYNNFDVVQDQEDNVESVLNNLPSEEAELARRVERALSEGFSQNESNSYEMLCRRHIQNFMQGAEQYARETQLSKRVSE